MITSKSVNQRILHGRDGILNRFWRLKVEKGVGGWRRKGILV